MAIINLHQTKIKIWVCDCGCSSFALLSDGSVECQNCGTSEDGGWDVPNGPDRAEDADAYFTDVQGNGSVEFARKRVQRLAQDDDVALVAVAKRDGRLHLWGDADGEDQSEWIGRRLDDLAALWRNKLK